MTDEQLTPKAAAERRAALMADREWGARYLRGDAAARREMEMLNRVIAGQSPEPSVNDREQARARRAELIADREWGVKYINGDAAAREEMHALNAALTEGKGQ